MERLINDIYDKFASFYGVKFCLVVQQNTFPSINCIDNFGELYHNFVQRMSESGKTVGKVLHHLL